MLPRMTPAEPSPGPMPRAKFGRSVVRVGLMLAARAGRPVGALAFAMALGWACVLAAQAKTPDPSQPYLQPPPGRPAPAQPPPSAGLLPEDQAPAPYTDNEGTDTRVETMATPGEDVPSAPPPAPEPPPRPATRPPRPRSAASFQPPPRPVPERTPSGRSATVIPPFSVRLDPAEILIEGRLGLQLELRLLSFLSLELTPLFLVSSTPLVWDLFAFNGRDDGLFQQSNGVGPLSGAAIGLGFWPSGRVFRGVVLRFQLTNYGIEYQSRLGSEIIDSAVFTERQFSITFGKAYRLGPVILEASAGLRYELNDAERCDLIREGGRFRASESGCDGKFLIATTSGSGGGAVELLDGLSPLALTGRLALGIVID